MKVELSRNEFFDVLTCLLLVIELLDEPVGNSPRKDALKRVVERLRAQTKGKRARRSRASERRK